MTLGYYDPEKRGPPRRRPDRSLKLVRRRPLALRELLASAGLVQPDLLALDLARVARHEPRFRQRRLELRIVVDQRAGDAAPDETPQAGEPSAKEEQLRLL